MSKFRLGKRYIAGIATLAFAVAGLSLSSAYATNEIDLSEPCSLTVSVGGEGAFAEDLAGIELQAELYRVAAVDQNGSYTSLEDYKSLELEKAVVGDGDWSEKAVAAAEIAEGKTADAKITIVDGIGTAEDLKAGMYLVVVETGVTECYEYNFSPYLICLPDNLYFQTGKAEDNYYQYDVTGGLKPEQSPRFGNLEINKFLSSYNTSLQDVTFVFEVEAVDENGTTVYSNVVSTTHSAAGTKSVLVEDLPAGAIVTVTEVYSGASYRVTTSASQTVTIVSGDTVEVQFSNAYAEELVPGYGVTNHFDYDENEGWQWSQLKDNSAVNQ